MSIIMKDQACKDWLSPEKPLWSARHEQEIDCVLCLPLATIAAIALVAIFAATLSQISGHLSIVQSL